MPSFLFIGIIHTNNSYSIKYSYYLNIIGIIYIAHWEILIFTQVVEGIIIRGTAP